MRLRIAPAHHCAMSTKWHSYFGARSLAGIRRSVDVRGAVLVAVAYAMVGGDGNCFLSSLKDAQSVAVFRLFVVWVRFFAKISCSAMVTFPPHHPTVHVLTVISVLQSQRMLPHAIFRSFVGRWRRILGEFRTPLVVPSNNGAFTSSLESERQPHVA